MLKSPKIVLWSRPGSFK